MTESLCQICKKQAFIIYKLNNEHYCPFCTSSILVIDIHYEEDIVPYTYCFCNKCNILCRYNLEKKHHTLNVYGNFYFAEIANNYEINNIFYNVMPKFNSLSYFLQLYETNSIKLIWKSFEKYDNCSICYENTCHTTECGHFLCETCIPKLYLNTCPICRTLFKYIKPSLTSNLYDDD